MASDQFEVYVNVQNGYPKGHRIECPVAKIHGGHRTVTGGHMEPFTTADEVELAGWETQLPFSWCLVCCEELATAATQ